MDGDEEEAVYKPAGVASEKELEGQRLLMIRWLARSLPLLMNFKTRQFLPVSTSEFSTTT